jgi:hypothetical protein
MVTALIVLAILVLLVLLVALVAIGDAVLHSREVPYSPHCHCCPENPANYEERAA